jgi:HAD superfamily hydrolase (TIGR01509 family)
VRTPGVRVVLFDYGNTLVAFGREQARVVDAATADAAAAHLPGTTPAAIGDVLRAVRDRLLRRALETGREIDPHEFAEGVATGAGARSAPEGLRDALVAATEEAFPRALRLPADTLPVLDALRASGARLGLVSNYWLARPIRRSLDDLGIAPRLDAVTVSADSGFVKPHPRPFEAALEALGAAAEECVFVGDNLACDVAGAKALGMRAVHTREWLHGALAADVHAAGSGPPPDATIDRLAELPALLGAGA